MTHSPPSSGPAGEQVNMPWASWNTGFSGSWSWWLQCQLCMMMEAEGGGEGRWRGVAGKG